MFNVNGPSVIEAPEWLPERPGRFHLYFAHHLGATIRVAFADRITGPWRVHPDGVLHVQDTPSVGILPHVASPDVHVDDANRRLIMYFHCPVDEAIGGHLPCWSEASDQKTLIATSVDGLGFDVLTRDRAISNSYLRMVPYGGRWFGMAMHSQLVRSDDGLTGFEVGPDLFGQERLRHSALAIDGDRLQIWFTRVGDCPERIFHSTVDLRSDWIDWAPSDPVEVLRPAEPWEGAELPETRSEVGPAFEPENALRDPFVFDTDGQRWLLYAGAGESALGAVKLDRPQPTGKPKNPRT